MSAPHRRKLFRDPIHDVISYDLESDFGRLMFALIDTRPVQRLRHVKQLGLAHYVYHGAEHSRFSHSMGAAWMADRMFEAMHAHGEPGEPGLRIATGAAALLHDVGHAPFSHTFEATLQRVLGFAGDHEHFTQRIVLWEEGDVHRVLSGIDPTLPGTVAAIIRHESGLYTEPVVSSQLDADRMDYLLRDGYMTGVQNYRYDAGRILEMLLHDEHGILVSSRALQAVESYLMSRFHMYQQVYFHKTVRAAEALIEGTFRRVFTLLQDGDRGALPAGPLGDLLRAALDGTEPEVTTYLEIDEATVWMALRQWRHHPDPILADLTARLESRRFHKTIEIPEHHVRAFVESTRLEADELVRRAGFDPAFYAVLDKSEDVPFRPYEPDPAAGARQRALPFAAAPDFDPDSSRPGQAIRVQLPGGRVAPIEQVSQVAEALTRIQYRVYRYCVPREVRDDVAALVASRHPG